MQVSLLLIFVVLDPIHAPVISVYNTCPGLTSVVNVMAPTQFLISVSTDEGFTFPLLIGAAAADGVKALRLTDRPQAHRFSLVVDFCWLA